jgi:hypothetical protein
MGLGFSAVWSSSWWPPRGETVARLHRRTAVNHRDGIELSGARTPWTQVAKAYRRRCLGPDPDDAADTLAIRAYSSGRHWLDTSGLDN